MRLHGIIVEATKEWENREDGTDFQSMKSRLFIKPDLTSKQLSLLSLQRAQFAQFACKETSHEWRFSKNNDKRKEVK
jgi:hypothetical protein